MSTCNASAVSGKGEMSRHLARALRAASVVLATLVPVAIPAGAWAGGQPNVLIVMTDDEPYARTGPMPFLDSQDDYVRFSRAFVNNPTCCPSRATFLTGLLSHHHGVEINNGAPLDARRTLVTAFDQAGYRTGLFGKYLNEYPFGRGLSYRPPGWDRWVTFQRIGNAYFDYDLNLGGRLRHYGAAPRDYSTDVLAGYAERFLRRDAEAPFLALYAPFGPHGPRVPAPRHQGVCAGERVPRTAAFNRLSTHPPSFYRQRNRVHGMKRIARRQCAALRSIDEAMEEFYEILESTGELDETIVVYLSDNGYSLGHHRWTTKGCLYDECAHVPLAIRAPGIAGTDEDALVSNVDVAPTIAELAGIDFGPTDGVSLVPLMRGQATTLSRPVLQHAVREDQTEPPTGWALRTEQWKLIRYNRGHVDLFNLLRDPAELRDLSGKRRFRKVRRDLTEQLEALRRQAPPSSRRGFW
jgi:arylsulfatase A-like enzyme